MELFLLILLLLLLFIVGPLFIDLIFDATKAWRKILKGKKPFDF